LLHYWVIYLPSVAMNQLMTQIGQSNPAPEPDASFALLHEMIRSFTTLAATLNLSHAVKELGSTRQTVRRHIAQLEEAKGVKLFNVVDRQYYLTEEGTRALPEAQDILARSQFWLKGAVRDIDGLQRLQHVAPGGWSFFQQRRPISDIWRGNSVLMRETVRGWALCGGEIDAPELEHVRPYLLVYRRLSEDWVCVEFGEQSFFVKWFGLAKARSSIGRPLDTMPGGDDFARLRDKSFTEIETTHSIRLDHIYMKAPREDSNTHETVNYHRLMMAGYFPDGSFALLSLVEPSDEIEIDSIKPEDIATPRPDDILVFDKNLAKFER